jgi:glycosidase
VKPVPVARSARRSLDLDAAGPTAIVELDPRDLHAARIVAARLAEPAVGAGDVAALAALHAILHAVVETAVREGRADLATAMAAARSRVGSPGVRSVARGWIDAFGPDDAATDAGAAAAMTRSDERLLPDLLVLAALNEDPAVGPVRPLVDDDPLRRGTPYEALVAAADDALGGRSAPIRPARRVAAGLRGRPAPRRLLPDAPLPVLLRAPAAAAPGSLAAQLRWIRQAWPELLASMPELGERLLLALDVVAEEERAMELRGLVGEPGGAAEPPGLGFGGGGAAATGGLHDPEREAFSEDLAWMPELVLVTKATFVWLDQLSRRYGRDIRTLDAIPEEELERLARLGITGLWLIGVWQRSRASAEIKRRRGDADAVASAYAIDDYRVADELGGEWAFGQLREKALRHGIRLCADMVPNHMGLDSRWVVEHPEWFVSVPRSPFPSYGFEGPDLSDDPGVEIKLEDHYWDNSDAAVVFRRRDRHSGDARFIYHGNDGTSFPWNDTAQLDYLQAEVREQVIRTILDVARRAPVIRFDAAMVLARRHVRRLWYPEPGAGGAIPSRAEHAMSAAAFDRAMPKEFWREVVDRVAAEAPGTLLLAEAFWLLEGYFVRTLGMHRVYNSAFMHMLRDEDNAKYRTVLRETLRFDPGVLQRFVNFMTNPDEKPAAEQFGTQDKAFAVATLLATLPGLPMLGHGQVEGLRERYGHEFRRARWDEAVDEGHEGHWERRVVPLLRQRRLFAGTSAFRLYDATADDGTVVEDVYAFTNGVGDERRLVLVHNREATVVVRVDRSIDGGRLADALGLDGDGGIRLVDERTGWETTRSVTELRREGLRVTLGAYEALVLRVAPVPAADPTPPAATAATEPAVRPGSAKAVDRPRTRQPRPKAPRKRVTPAAAPRRGRTPKPGP